MCKSTDFTNARDLQWKIIKIGSQASFPRLHNYLLICNSPIRNTTNEKR